MEYKITNHNHQMPGTNIRSGELGNNAKSFFDDSLVKSGGKEKDLTNPVLFLEDDAVSRIDGL